jgi:hypothetical protein
MKEQPLRKVVEFPLWEWTGKKLPSGFLSWRRWPLLPNESGYCFVHLKFSKPFPAIGHKND